MNLYILWVYTTRDRRGPTIKTAAMCSNSARACAMAEAKGFTVSSWSIGDQMEARNAFWLTRAPWA